MNLKEKWTKQNNSVKVLLRKLKRHDTVVVAIAVVIAVVLCGGLIYLSTPVVAASAKDELVEVQNRDNEQTIEKLDELSEYLNGLDKSITESKDSMADFYEKDGADKIKSEKNTEKITNTVTDKVTSLGKDLTNIHETITNTQTDIDKLKELIEKGAEASDKNLTENFTNIYNNLEEIQDSMNKSQSDTAALIEEVRNAMKNGDDKLSKELMDSYKDLLDKLNASSDNLTRQNGENLESFKEEISALSSMITSKLNELSANVNNEMNDLSTNIDNHFTTMNVSFEGDMEALKQCLESQMSDINNNLTQVFTFVSRGKKLLASALLTKNIEVKEDATFLEIAKAIESIPVKIVLDKDDVPGKVEYIYHFHKDGTGKECNEAYVSVARKGGCYEAEVRHHHNRDCYNYSNTYHFFAMDNVVQGGHVGDSSSGHARYSWHCNYCGRDFESDHPGHEEWTDDYNVFKKRAYDVIEIIENKSLKCGMGENQLIGYKTACNLVHGQVISAKITFAEEYSNYDTIKDNYRTNALDTSLLMMPESRMLTNFELFSDFPLEEVKEETDDPMEDEETISDENEPDLLEESDEELEEPNNNEGENNNINDEVEYDPNDDKDSTDSSGDSNGDDAGTIEFDNGSISDTAIEEVEDLQQDTNCE